MSDRAALLAAICANPDDDTARLVYADWLDENGQAKRAAHIRAQIEYHQLATADTTTNAVEDFLNQQQYADAARRVNWAAVDADLGARLAARQKNEKPTSLRHKVEGVPEVPGVIIDNKARGFFDTMCVIDPDAFLAHADAIFRAVPITRVDFENLTVEQAKEFVASGHLARLRELSLTSDVESEAIRVLGTHRDAAGVRKLDILPDLDEASAVESLAAGKHWTGLESLALSDLCDGDTPPEEEQMAALFARPQFRNLREIDAWGSNSGNAALRAIVKNMPELRVLKLALNPIANGDRTLAAAKNLRHLRVLDLESCDMDGGDPTALIAGPNFPNLTVLRLEGNSLREPNPKVLAKSNRGPGLRVLDLGDSQFTPRGVEELVKCPAIRGLWFLSLAACSLEDDHVERFTQHAAFDRLAFLNLGINDITARGAKALAAWPGAANLQSLDLWSNRLGAAGAKALAASPHLKRLKYLHANKSDVLQKRFKTVFV